MKMIYAFLLPVLILLTATAAQAQPGTVLLQDAGGNAVNTFASIKAAYDAIPVPLTQAYTIALGPGYAGFHGSEASPLRFNAKAGADALHTITIRRQTIAGNPFFATLAARTDTTDYIIFDGASWITIDGQNPPPFEQGIYLRGMGAGGHLHPIVRYINGATHNTIRYCDITHSQRGMGHSAAPCFSFEESPNAPAGNSDNVIEHNLLDVDYGIASKGTPAHPNTGLIIRDNRFEYIYRNALKLEEGTGSVLFDHNTILAEAHYDSVLVVRVLQLDDTARFTRNTIYLSNNGALSGQTTAFAITPSAAFGSAHYCIVANNYISGYSVSNGPIVDNVRSDIRGFDLTAPYQVHALIAHNTARLSATITTDTVHSFYSSLIRQTGTNAVGTDVRIYNNILQNLRQNSTSRSTHLAVDLQDTSGLTLDYNIYGRDSLLARLGSRIFSQLADYQSAFPQCEAHTNDSVLLFESTDGPYLTAFYTGNPAVAGKPLSLITTDIDSVMRTLPYRGAEELTTNCTAPAGPMAINAFSDSTCVNVPFMLTFWQYPYLFLDPVFPANGVIHQWQRRTQSASDFTDIPGAHTKEVTVTQSEYTIYRVKDSCIGSGLVTYSLPKGIAIKTPFMVDSIGIVELSALTYQFTAWRAAGDNANGYRWDFGDGTVSGPATSNSAIHTYSRPDTFTVMVSFESLCDTPNSRRFYAALNTPPSGISGTAQPGAFRMYPSPAHEQLTIVQGAGSGHIRITDLAGHTLLEATLKDRQITLDIHALPAGLYLLEYTGGGQRTTQRFSVLH